MTTNGSGPHPAEQLAPREEWRRYWTLVLAASVGASFMSFMTPVIGVFMEPLTGTFGWTRTQLSAGLARRGWSACSGWRASAASSSRAR